MKTKKEIIEKINELEMEAKNIDKILNNDNTDYEVWKSLDRDLTECCIKIDILEWIIKE